MGRDEVEGGGEETAWKVRDIGKGMREGRCSEGTVGTGRGLWGQGGDCGDRSAGRGLTGRDSHSEHRFPAPSLQTLPDLVTQVSK